MKDKYHEPLSEWQKRNCAGCKFVDEKRVGTGEACCTYFMMLEMDDDGECKTRELKHG